MRLRVMTVILLILVWPALGYCQAHIPLPADLQGELNGVPYRILVPANWNGTLLVYNHGYSAGPIPPNLALQPPDVANLSGRGFAMAASRFGGTGWNVKEGMQNTAALTAAFREWVGRPQRTIVWGGSMGGLMTLGLIEKHPGLYDGAVALCPPASGTPRRFDLGLDIALAYAVTFGWKDEWGTPGDIRDDLNFTTDVQPYIAGESTDAEKGGWEFIRLLNKMPIDSYYLPMNFKVTNLYFATGVRAELEARAGGPVAGNDGRLYSLTDAEKQYLATYGIDADGLLLQMNQRAKYKPAPNARNYAEHYVNPTGRINRPVLTLHTKGDSLAIPSHESAYRAVVVSQNNGDLLMQQYTNGPAHCTFSSAQDIAGIDAMMNWLDTGNHPDPTIYFPASKGFDPLYVPPDWPW